MSFGRFSIGVYEVALKLELGTSSFSVSSTYGEWYPHHMMVDKITGWIAEGNDPNPWIQVDMEDAYTIVGFYLRRYNQYYLTSYNLKVSVDESNYAYIQKDIATDFSNDDTLSSTYWFANPTVGRYWVIEVVSHNMYRFVKGDFIGYVWDACISLSCAEGGGGCWKILEKTI